MKPANLLVVMADEHSRKVAGCYGHPMVQTPQLDALAARGTRFAAAYTPSPICVPARAAFAAGRYVHQGGWWDNAHPFDGRVPSWQSVLRDRGHEVVSVGKLHFRGEGDNGFAQEILPMHVVDGVGDVLGLIRDRVFERGAAYKMAALAGPGESSYTTYDREIAARAQAWLRAHADRRSALPWVLFVSFVTPHFPLTAPPEFYERYDLARIGLPKLYRPEERPRHPFLEDYANSLAYDRHFDEASVARALAGYYGLCSFVDDLFGQLLTTLEASGLSAKTRVVYLSDHGDNLGARGLWGKSTMYEESVGVPLVMAGPDIAPGVVVERPVSLLDIVPFILASVGARPDALPGMVGRLLLRPDVADAPVFSEYHATGSRTGAFMLRNGPLKYVYYPRYPEQLFDLEKDPEETTDLAAEPAYAARKEALREALWRICDPDAVDRRARADQRALIERLGGEEAILRRGDFGFSPPPGEKAAFS
ncbi:sulfatase-like hydrolase/transferase [Elioraea sp.]|uniref:sulfatase-like hydrolase/transferase n=1 Tax=Elioraea sp. TaxID=2185103 RepID=UPI003F6F217B